MIRESGMIKDVVPENVYKALVNFNLEKLWWKKKSHS